MLIRPAQRSDLAAITEIYNQAVEKTAATFDLQPVSLSQQQAWFDRHDDRHPILAAEIEGEVVGWASLSELNPRPAYADTAEVSLYVAETFRNQGIGRKLLEAILQEGKNARLHTIVAWVAQDSAASLHLHQSLGFKPAGLIKEVGRKFGRLLDVHILQKML